MLYRLLTGFSIILFSTQAYSLEGCERPSKPDCSKLSTTYEILEATQECSMVLKEFSDATNAYVDCERTTLQKLVDETKAAVDEASAEANELIEKFNCKVEKTC